MRKKLILILIIIGLMVIIVNIVKNKNIFVKNTNQIEMLTEKDFKDTDTLLKNLSSQKTSDVLPGITPKYEVLDNKNLAQYCNKESGTVLISQEEGYDVISYGDNNDFSYYRIKGKSCALIGTIKNVNFQVSSNEIYANDSIYGTYESLTDYNMRGLLRIDKDGVTPLDTIDKRYTNPLNVDGNVLAVENYQSVVVFNNDNKIIAKQNNDNNNREVLAVNKAGDSLIMLVKKNNKFYLEGYNSLDLDNLDTIKPLVTYELNNEFKIGDKIDFTIKNDKDFAVFITSDQVLVVQNDLSKVILLGKNYDVIDLIAGNAIAKIDENYYILNFTKMEKEKIGDLKSVSLRLMTRNLYFGVLDSKNKEIYIRFTIK